jgi:hypothetical protein
MSAKRPLTLALAGVLSVAMSASAVGQTEKPEAGPYALVAYVGGGLGYYPISPGSPPPGVPSELTRFGPSGTVRLMWHPDHLIRLGVETGWTMLYSYSLQQAPAGELYLSAVPLLWVMSMEVLGVNLFAGSGYYLLNSNLEYEGTTNVQTLSLGWMLAASYVRPISENLGVAGELKWINASEHEEASLALQVQLVWKVLEW